MGSPDSVGHRQLSTRFGGWHPRPIPGGVAAMILVGVAVIGVVLRQAGVPWLGELLYVVSLSFLVVTAVHKALVAACLSTLLLAVAESAMVPPRINTLAPLLVVWLIALALASERRIPRLNVVTWAVLVLGASAAVGTVLGQSIGAAARIALIGLMWVAVAIVGSVVVQQGLARRFGGFLLAMGAGLVLLTVIETLIPWSALRSAVFANADGEYIVRANTILGDWLNRAQATFGYPIPLALFLALCLVIALVSTELRAPLRVSLVTAFSIGILLTGTRSALIAVGAGVGAYLLSRLFSARRERLSRREWILPAVLTAAAGVGAAVYLARSIATADFSLTHRLGMLGSVLDAAFDRHPVSVLVGGGRGSVAQAVADGVLVSDGHAAMDNTYAFVLYSYGVVGLIALITAVGFALWHATHVMRAALVTVLTGFAFLDGTEWHALALVLFLLLGMGSSARRVESSPARHVAPLPRPTRQMPPGYRADIQGLRAVAVLAVFADHLFAWPGGGFVGVDVFFVISGFLITGILVREFRATGRISFGDFYRRRVRRLIPAAMLTIFVVVVASAVLFPASRARETLWDGISATFFASNWRFAATGTDYFAQGAISPLRHFWSLSVEEQFYFVWPWVMLGILLWSTAMAKRSADRSVRLTGWVLVSAAALSFVWSIIQSSTDPTIAYFSTATRMWELAVGGAIAMFATSFAGLRAGAKSALAWAGLGLIGVSLLVITPDSAFPGPWALLPVGGAALVVMAGIGGEPRGNVLLTNRFSRYVGDISYSLYLWHWPVIVILGAMFDTQGAAYYLTLLAASFLLAGISYEFVERPLNSSPWLRRFTARDARRAAWVGWRQTFIDRVSGWRIPAVVGLICAALVVVNMLPAGLLHRGGEPPRTVQTDSSDPLVQGIASSVNSIEWPDVTTPSVDEVAVEGMPQEDALNCDDPRPESTSCLFGDGEERSILVYGDSLATTLLPTVRAAYEEDSVIRGLSRFSCAVTDLDVQFASEERESKCMDHRRGVREVTRAMKPDIVFVIQNYAWAWALTSKAVGADLVREWRGASEGLRDDLIRAGAAQVVFVSPPPLGKSIVDCATATAVPSDCVATIPEIWMTVHAAEGEGDLRYLDETDLFCVEERCPVLNGNVVVRRDDVHPTRQYAELIAPSWRERAEAVLGQ